MSEKFEVGEVAIFWCPGGYCHGMDVAIVSPLYPGQYLRDGQIHSDLIHQVDCPQFRSGFVWACPVGNLRKKRPPQDWVTLCKLDSVPKAEPAEVA